MLMINRVKILLDQRFQPESYITCLDFMQAEQSAIVHTHIHLIPRYPKVLNALP